MSVVLTTRSIDIDCTTCGAMRGNVCTREWLGKKFCRSRISDAIRLTREANRAARLKSRK